MSRAARRLERWKKGNYDLKCQNAKQRRGGRGATLRRPFSKKGVELERRVLFGPRYTPRQDPSGLHHCQYSLPACQVCSAGNDVKKFGFIFYVLLASGWFISNAIEVRCRYN